MDNINAYAFDQSLYSSMCTYGLFLGLSCPVLTAITGQAQIDSCAPDSQAQNRG